MDARGQANTLASRIREADGEVVKGRLKMLKGEIEWKEVGYS
jgi:hypothetical protein